MRMYHCSRVRSIQSIEQPESRDGKHPSTRTVKKAIDEKMKVLKEFCVVDIRNEDKIREKLEKAVAGKPEMDFDMVLDRVAKRMINEKLGG